MSFLLKKIIAALLLPLPISLICLLIGLILLFSRKLKSGITFFMLGFFILIIFSFNFLPNYLVGHLESHYKPLISVPKNVHAIVVLGGGVRANTHYPPNTQLNSASLSRLIEGIRLYRQLKNKGVDAKLILSGGRVFSAPSEAGKMQNTAVILGVLRKDIIIEDGSKNTYQEALYLKPQLKKRTFILVTSAVHMPRAMQIFTRLGMNPIAAPTQYIEKRYTPNFHYFIPSSLNLVYSDIAIHEYLGMIYNKFKD